MIRFAKYILSTQLEIRKQKKLFVDLRGILNFIL